MPKTNNFDQYNMNSSDVISKSEQGNFFPKLLNGVLSYVGVKTVFMTVGAIVSAIGVNDEWTAEKMAELKKPNQPDWYRYQLQNALNNEIFSSDAAVFKAEFESEGYSPKKATEKAFLKNVWQYGAFPERNIINLAKSFHDEVLVDKKAPEQTKQTTLDY